MGPEAVEGTPEQLSGVAVVIIIAVGVQTFIMLFIFAKRQIMRFTLRSRRGPHVSVGQGGVKAQSGAGAQGWGGLRTQARTSAGLG